jgi:hypothetical protein
MLLQPELVLEDVSQDHARKTVRYGISIDYQHTSTPIEFATINVNMLFLT